MEKLIKMGPKVSPNGCQNAPKMFKRSRLKAKGPQNEPKRPEIWHVKNDEEISEIRRRPQQ